MFLLIFVLVLALIAPFYAIYKPPNLLIRYFQYKWPEVLFHVPMRNGRKIIALTIDDAPTQYTSEILDILQENDSRATFFIIGSQVEDDSSISLLAEIVRRGHELGNHAMYDEPSRRLEMQVFSEQLERVDKLIETAYHDANVTRLDRFFRPGSGFFSSRMIDTARSHGYQVILGSIYPHDPQIPHWRINARHILSMARNGGVIICHDRRSWTLPMLREVLPKLKTRGYEAVSVGELIRSTA